jgi:hypothetical protein
VAVLKPRERLVYFRISEDEFRQFVSVCEQVGARSMSDLARNAVQGLIANGQRQRQSEVLDQKMQVLEDLIAAVTEQLRMLSTNSTHQNGHPQLANSATELNFGANPNVPKDGQEH